MSSTQLSKLIKKPLLVFVFLFSALLTTHYSLLTTAKAAEVASLSQGYKSQATLAPGTLVKLVKDSSDTVSAASLDQAGDLLGIVVRQDDVLLTLSSGEANVQVATSGVVSALVTNLTGDVRAGDKLSLSAITGVAGRAASSGQVIGTAQADFNPLGTGVQEVEVTTKSGAKQKTKVGRVPVLIDIAFYTPQPIEETILPGALQRVFDSLAKKHVSPVRIIAALILIVLGLLIASVLIYGASRSSIISIGRNPLSQPAIRRSLLQVIAVAVGILLLTLGAVYFIISR